MTTSGSLCAVAEAESLVSKSVRVEYTLILMPVWAVKVAKIF